MPLVMAFTPSKTSTPFKQVYGSKTKQMMAQMQNLINALQEENIELKKTVHHLDERVESLEQQVRTGLQQFQALEMSLQEVEPPPSSQEQSSSEIVSFPAKKTLTINSIEEIVAQKVEKAALSLKEQHEKKERALNLRIVGLQEEENEKEDLQLSLSNFFRNVMHIPEPQWQEAFRVGKTAKQGERPRHIIIKFKDALQRAKVLKHKHHLKGEKVWINEDLTREQYSLRKEEWEKVKAAKKEGKTAYIRNGKAVIGHMQTKGNALTK